MRGAAEVTAMVGMLRCQGSTRIPGLGVLAPLSTICETPLHTWVLLGNKGL